MFWESKALPALSNDAQHIFSTCLRDICGMNKSQAQPLPYLKGTSDKNQQESPLVIFLRL